MPLGKPEYRAPALRVTRRHFSLSALTLAGSAWLPPAMAQHGQREPIVIGQTAILSGPLAVNGLAWIEGQSMVIDKLNAAGGVQGRPVKILTYDDAYSGEKAAENAEQLLGTDKALCMFAVMGVPTGLAVAKVTAKYDSFVFGGFTGAEALRDPAMPIYHVRASYADEVRRAVYHLRAIGIRNIATVVSDDLFGRTFEPIVQSALAESGEPAVASLRFDPKEADLRPTAAQLKATQAKAVYVVATGTASINVMRALTEDPAHPAIYANSSVASHLFHKELGEKARGIVISQVVPPYWKTTKPVTKAYLAALKDARKEDKAGYVNFEGYLNALALVEVLKHVRGSITTASLRHVLVNADFDLGGYRLRYKPGQRNGSAFVDFTMIGSNGKFVE